MTVRMWPTLPKDAESNGLHVIEKLLIDEPGKRHVVIAIIDRKRVTPSKTTTTETIPTARVLHIEPITVELDENQARRILVEAHTKRTGAQTLLFEAARDQDHDGDELDDDDDDLTSSPAPRQPLPSGCRGSASALRPQPHQHRHRPHRQRLATTARVCPPDDMRGHQRLHWIRAQIREHIP